MDDRGQFIQSNLRKLTQLTMVGTELVTNLLEKSLITETEYDLLMDKRTPNAERASLLYIKLAKKWTENTFQDFLQILSESGNATASSIFSANGGELYLPDSHIGILKEEALKSSDCGSYEGICYNEERVANEVSKYLKDKKIIFGEKFLLDKELDRKIVVPCIKNFTSALKAKRIWLNPWKQKLPINYIKKRWCRKLTNEDGRNYDLLNIITSNQVNQNLESNVGIENSQKLVLLVDPPGMGKSSFLTELERDLRKVVAKNDRIIVRINLNLVQQTLIKTVSTRKISLEEFLENFVKNIPSVKVLCCSSGKLPVFLFLDGLDEVLPMHKTAMMNILQSMLNNTGPNYDKQGGTYVEKVVLTTRPHLKDLIEAEFNVTAYSLYPLTIAQQVEFIIKSPAANEVKVSEEEVKQNLHDLSDMDEELLGNPLMLTLYSSSVGLGKNEFNKFSLYNNFMERKHVHHVQSKENGCLAEQHTNLRLRFMMKKFTRFYSFLSIKQLLDEDGASHIFQIHNECGKKILKEPIEEDDVITLLSYGVVMNITDVSHDQMMFQHRSFAEFFYAKMLTDIQLTPTEVRNIMFALGYRFGENIAEFVGCKIKSDFSIGTQMISKGWTKYAPETDIGETSVLRLYRGEGTFKDDSFLNHVLSETMDYAGCVKTRSIIVRSCYETDEEQNIFLNWLRRKASQGNDEIEWIRKNVFHVNGAGEVAKNMEEVVVAIAFSGGDFVDLSPFLSDNEVKEAILRCPVALQVAVKWKYLKENKDVTGEINLANLLGRLRWWSMTDSEITDKMRKELTTDSKFGDLFFRDVLSDCDLCWFLREKLSTKELLQLITNEETRVSDIGRLKIENVCLCFGEQFVPKILSFTVKYYCDEDEQPLCGYPIADEIVDYFLWDEIESAIMDESEFSCSSEVQISDPDVKILEGLERSISRAKGWEGCHREMTWFPHSPCRLELAEIFRRRKNNFFKLATACEKFNLSEINSWQSMAFCLAQNSLELSGDLEISEFDEDPENHGEILAAGKCLLLSAIKQRRTEFHEEEMDVYYLIRRMIQTNIQKMPEEWKLYMNLIILATDEAGRSEIKNMNENVLTNFYFVNEVPVWDTLLEVIIRNEDAITKTWKKLTMKQWCFLVTEMMKSKFTGCFCLQGNLLHKIRNAIFDDVMLKEVLTDDNVISSVVGKIKTCWETCHFSSGCPQAECLIMSIVKFYVKTFEGDDCDFEWVQKQRMFSSIPVELLSAAQEIHNTSNSKNFLPKVQALIKGLIPHGLGFKDVINYSWRYRRERDWMILLKLSGCGVIISTTDGCDSERVFSHYSSALISAWMKCFGKDESKRLLRMREFEHTFLECIIMDALRDMTNGELLHVVVELGSLLGVKLLAWPGVVSWLNKQGKSALDLSIHHWGDNHEISQFLCKKLSALKHCQ